MYARKEYLLNYKGCSPNDELVGLFSDRLSVFFNGRMDKKSDFFNGTAVSVCVGSDAFPCVHIILESDGELYDTVNTYDPSNAMTLLREDVMFDRMVPVGSGNFTDERNNARHVTIWRIMC